MKIKFLSLLAVFLFVGCGEGESEIAKKIKLRVSSGGIVLPNKLLGTNTDVGVPSTCSTEDISPPRVRLRASVSWAGGVEYGVLVPFVMQFDIDDANIGKYTGAIASAEGKESISSLFGAETDFIPSSDEVFSSVSCFADFGGLPSPNPPLTGRRQIVVKAKVIMAGVTRTTTANLEKGPNVELPFVKEVATDILYTAGSVPTR
jgi:hypothetical protein